MKKHLLLLTLVLFFAVAGCSEQSNLSGTMELRVETEHFLLYSYPEDAQVAELIAATLEEEYPVITSQLQTELPEKVGVSVYPNMDLFRRAINDTSTGDWVTGVAWGNKIEMISPNNPGTAPAADEVTRVAVHEFTHLVVAAINPTAPKWLNEGVAVYYGKEREESKIRQLVMSKLEKGTLPAIRQFETSSQAFFEQDGYSIAYSIIDFIVSRYGTGALVGFIQHPTDYDRIFGVDEDSFVNAWKEYIEETY